VIGENVNRNSIIKSPAAIAALTFLGSNALAHVSPNQPFKIVAPFTGRQGPDVLLPRVAKTTKKQTSSLIDCQKELEHEP